MKSKNSQNKSKSTSKMIPYKLDKVTIGKYYQEPVRPVQFTRDEEFIQDLLLNKPVQMHDTFEMVSIYVIALFFIAILLWGFR